MARMGYCPQGRLFEAAACEAVVISDWWEGLDEFFAADEEIFCVETTDDVLEVLELSQSARQRMGRAARERVLAQHTSSHRADELVRLLMATPSASELYRLSEKATRPGEGRVEGTT